MAAPPDLINDPPSLICLLQRPWARRARTLFYRLRSSFFRHRSSLHGLYLLRRMRGTERSARKSSGGRGKETNVYFGLGAKIARERHFLDIYDLKVRHTCLQ